MRSNRLPPGTTAGNNKERRKLEYWYYRDHNMCVDCGSADYRTVNGMCRCETCQKKHNEAKSSYCYRMESSHLVGSGRRSWH